MDHTLTVDPQPPTPLLRNQNSLEHILSFTLYSPLPSTKELADAELLYHEIIHGCEEARIFIVPSGTDVDTPAVHPAGDNDNDDDDDSEDLPFDDRVYVHKLFECLFFYCPTTAGRNNIVRMVLIALFAPNPDPADYTARSLTSILPLARQYLSSTPPQQAAIFATLQLLAHEVLNSFFIPLQAQGRNTPSVTSLISPTSRSEASPHQGVRTRLLNLRALVLARDNYACVVCGLPDIGVVESRKRRRRQTQVPKATPTEAAHIIPHSLNALDNRLTLSEQKHTVWRVMNMFDPGVAQTLEGELIDSPANSILLAADLHRRFGRLAAYFEEIDDSEGADEAVAYRFMFVEGSVPVLSEMEPRERIVFVNHEPQGTARSRLPSRRLLKLHRACCLILSMSGAAGYVEKVLEDAEEVLLKGELAADGGTNLSALLRVRGLCDDVGLDFGRERGKEVMVQ